MNEVASYLASLVPRPSPLTCTFTRRDRCACGQLKAGKAWSETSREVDAGGVWHRQFTHASRFDHAVFYVCSPFKCLDQFRKASES